MSSTDMNISVAKVGKLFTPGIPHNVQVNQLMLLKAAYRKTLVNNPFDSSFVGMTSKHSETRMVMAV